eukprot:Em0011g1196a
MDDITIESDFVSQVDKALYQLYHDLDHDNRTAAERWLLEVQQSPQAWQACWLLLQQQNLEIQNFGALTLASKISKSWSELPADQYEPLRAELLKAVLKFSTGHRVVLTRLCVALTHFAFHTMPELWPHAVVSMIHSLQKGFPTFPEADPTAAILHLLSIVPEEFSSTAETMLAYKRGILRNELHTSLETVLSFLEQVLSSTQPNSIKTMAIKCYTSWTQFGLPLTQVSPLLDQLFQALYDPELFASACEALTEAVSHDDARKYTEGLKQFFNRVLELGDFIRSKLEGGDEDSVTALCKFVNETLEANMDFLLSVSEESEEGCQEALDGVQLLQAFLSVPGYYPVDERCSVLTIPFWEQFLERISGEEPHHTHFLLQFYNPILLSIIEVCPEKSQYPSDDDWGNTWTNDDKDSFVKYREDLCDLGESLQQVMHVEYLQYLTRQMTAVLATSSVQWQPVEAILFLLQGVASSGTSHQNSHLLQSVLCLFPRMPPHPSLIRTALAFLGCLSSWFKNHMDLLQAVLPTILEGLSQPELAPSAALAFRDVCGECAEKLAPYILQLIPACESSLSNPRLEARDCVRMVAAIGNVLSTMPLQDLSAPLGVLMTSRVKSLEMLAHQNPSNAVKPLVEKELLIVSAFCHHIYPTLLDGEQHPVVILLAQLWPSLHALINKWCIDQDIVEGVCTCWSRAVRTVQEQYTPLLEGTVDLIVKCFTAVHNPRLLDCASHLLEVFHKQPSCVPLLEMMLKELHLQSLSHLQLVPELLQAYLHLMFTLNQPAVFGPSQQLNSTCCGVGSFPSSSITAAVTIAFVAVLADTTFVQSIFSIGSGMIELDQQANVDLRKAAGFIPRPAYGHSCG